MDENVNKFIVMCIEEDKLKLNDLSEIFIEDFNKNFNGEIIMDLMSKIIIIYDELN